jgi:hypothetical protein
MKRGKKLEVSRINLATQRMARDNRFPASKHAILAFIINL